MNSSIHALFKKIKHQTLKIKVVLTMSLIVIASIWFALQSQPVVHVTPDAVVVRLSLDQALNLSLAVGDGRQVDWGRVA